MDRETTGRLQVVMVRNDCSNEGCDNAKLVQDNRRGVVFVEVCNRRKRVESTCWALRPLLRDLEAAHNCDVGLGCRETWIVAERTAGHTNGAIVEEKCFAELYDCVLRHQRPRKYRSTAQVLLSKAMGQKLRF